MGPEPHEQSVNHGMWLIGAGKLTPGMCVCSYMSSREQLGSVVINLKVLGSQSWSRPMGGGGGGVDSHLGLAI